MGMYTEFHFNVQLHKDVSAETLYMLSYMLGNTSTQLAPTPAHPLFDTECWGFMLIKDSYYFAADTHSTLRYDDIARAWFLCIRCNLKNYGHEIQKFIDWILPEVDAEPGDFLGFHRYESTQQPTLIHMPTEDAFPGLDSLISEGYKDAP